MFRSLILCLGISIAAGFAPSASAVACVRISHHTTHSRPIFSAAVSGRAASVYPAKQSQRVASAPMMGLFGLGAPEIAVIALVGLFVVGPENLKPLVKDLGKQAAGLKQVVDDEKDGALQGVKAGLSDVADAFKEGAAEAETGISSDGGDKAIKSAKAEEKKEEAA